MDDLDTKRKRLRYLELKQKASMGAQAVQSAPEEAPRSMIGKAWNTAGIPMRKSEEGLEMLAQMMTPSPEFTGNLPRDLIKNYPTMSARTLSKVAPSFISPETLLGGALAKPISSIGKATRSVARPAGRWLGAQLEEFDGMIPGSLREAFVDSSAMFGKGKKAAQPFYNEGKVVRPGGPTINPSAVFDEKGILKGLPDKEIKQLQETMKNSLEHKDVVQAADRLADAGALDPADALKARKSIDRMIRTKSAPLDTLFDKRKKIDKIVKSDANLSKGDELHEKGMMSESLRSVFPKTAGGKPSSWKTMMAGLSGIPALFSPAALGATSTLAGLAGRKLISPLIDAPRKATMSAVALLRQRMKEEE